MPDNFDFNRLTPKEQKQLQREHKRRLATVHAFAVEHAIPVATDTDIYGLCVGLVASILDHEDDPVAKQLSLVAMGTDLSKRLVEQESQRTTLVGVKNNRVAQLEMLAKHEIK